MVSLSTHVTITTEKNILVRMRDGVELAVDLYRSEGVENSPVILSVYPYHKDGMVGAGSQHQISYFVKRGYACVMADCRGTGNSGGITTDALDGLNGEDLYELVEWIARQRWCDGNIGMMGMSYGGMTALKAATMRPPHLKAIVSIMAPSAFYHNLAFPGGSLNMLGLCGAWCGLMHCMNLMPPFYQDPEGRWENIWKEHLDNYTPYLIGPTEHLNYDDYWKERDIPLAKIDVPIYVIEGWHDFALPDGIRQYAAAQGPKKILIGPWIHFYLDLISVEPIDHLHEICRWFDHWLKGVNTGVMDEPPVAVCVQPVNEWRFVKEWPVPGAKERSWQLGKKGTLKAGNRPSADFMQQYSINPAAGTQAGLMTVMPLGIDYPQDQRPDDALSVSFDSEPLRSDLEILGEPRCRLFISSTHSDANLVVKLCDVAPSGISSLVATGWLRASHRKSHEAPSPLSPAEIYETEIKIWPTAYRFRAGHRIRLSIACSDFPRIWPATENGEVTLYGGKSHPSSLVLPIVRKTNMQNRVPTFQAPDLSYLLEVSRVWLPHWRVIEDRASRTLNVESGVHAEFPLPSGGDFRLTHNYRASLSGKDLQSPSMTAKTRCEANVGERGFTIEVDSHMTPTRIDVKAEIVRDSTVVFQKNFVGEFKI